MVAIRFGFSGQQMVELPHEAHGQPLDLVDTELDEFRPSRMRAG